MNSAQTIIQNSTLFALFQITGQIFWALVCVVGIVTIANKTFRSWFPKKIKGIGK